MMEVLGWKYLGGSTWVEVEELAMTQSILSALVAAVMLSMLASGPAGGQTGFQLLSASRAPAGNGGSSSHVKVFDVQTGW